MTLAEATQPPLPAAAVDQQASGAAIIEQVTVIQFELPLEGEDAA